MTEKTSEPPVPLGNVRQTKADLTFELYVSRGGPDGEGVDSYRVEIYDPTAIHLTKRGVLISREDEHGRKWTEFWNWRVIAGYRLGSALWGRFLED